MPAILRLTFSSHIKKVKYLTMGGKGCVQVAIAKKNYAKQGDEPDWTWVNILITSPPDYLKEKIQKDAIIAGSGELSLKSFKNKVGETQKSLEVWCTGRDINVYESTEKATEALERKKTEPALKPIAKISQADDAEPPF